MQAVFRSGLCAAMILLSACSPKPETTSRQDAAEHGEQSANAKGEQAEKAEKGEAVERGEAAEKEGGEAEAKEDFVALSDQQIKAAGIEVMPVRQSFAGAVEAPAVIAADPKHAAVVSSAVGGRVVEIRRNLGDPVARGDVLAVIESRDVAQLRADVEIAKRQYELSQANFAREERLYGEKVTSRQEFEIARNAAQEARTRLRLAEQQLAAAGASSGGQLNRLMLRSPIKGNVTARQIALGDIVAPDAHLFEVADLNELTAELSLSPDDAARIAVGTTVDVSTDGRTGTGRITHVSRVLDPATRQVRAIARLSNGRGAWRIGETVRASIALEGSAGGTQLAIPRTAVQTVEDRPSVFVRARDGFAIKHVVLGGNAAGYVKVMGGLEGNEQIAVSNTYLLKAEHGKGEAGDDD
ncbi:efflux RND transporter periplasmic adaptor subunit [Massilia sp. YIM B02769]|jgi:cobalt-zinc-cadmium efflux system membrane fusion protein|uniref:efflux RND transporter periplasmic adaptor subunit n=1 Tax=Massilia sp. YIM B02769 TaxID=3050129 RepID=UPI0025B67D8E|nr:efflux RND transporter periplasmic adaptor subunit [Massilia sp. YIM B02769]MDN4059200.1 efflux RND transporter periplasmic adaptor subunit [Massilia sp. YIM B02769]